MQIRDAREQDRDAIYEAHVGAVRGIEQSVYTETELSVWEAGISPGMYSVSEQNSVFLVAETDASIAGLGEATLDDPEIDKCYVETDYQGHGVASELVDALEVRLQHHGADTVTVESSLNAAPFYESVGYERVGTHEKPVAADGTTVEMTMVDLEKRLG
jgi:ribosomal protein S18 acetylase RimI-like enzyme